MSDALLPYFERELSRDPQARGRIRGGNPKVASRLRMTADTVDDPHVERLLEGVAFLAARVQHRLDDELPETVGRAAGAVVPASPGAGAVDDDDQARCPKPEATGPSQVPRGTPLQTEPVRGEPLQYRTCHETVSGRWRSSRRGWPGCRSPRRPIRMRRARWRCCGSSSDDRAGADLRRSRPGPATALPARHRSSSRPQMLSCSALHAVDRARGWTRRIRAPTFLRREMLTHAGFEHEEAALPWPQRAFSGHRLLTEYFAFPEKFLYLNLAGLEARSLVQRSGKMEVFIYLSRTASELERTVSAENFALAVRLRSTCSRSLPSPSRSTGRNPNGW